MKIDRHNFEAFLLDQLEGRLSVEEQQELETFLLMNPDCSRELTEHEPWVLHGEHISFQESEKLKKSFPDRSSVLTDHNFDLFSIARMEGDLGSEQIKAHQAMLEDNEQKAQQWKQWQKLRLPAEPVTFRGKDRLLHNKTLKGRALWISAISAAAAVALLVVLFRTDPDLPKQVSYVQPPQEELSSQSTDLTSEEEMDAENFPDNEVQHDPVRDAASSVSASANNFMTVVDTEFEPKTDPEPLSMEEVLAAEQLEVLSSALSAEQFNSSSIIKEAAPDQIEPLIISPLPTHNSSFSLAQISEMGVQEVIEEYAREKDFSLWKIADAGIRGINKLSGSDISLMASRDKDGDVSGFQLKSKRFSLTRPLGREE